MITLFVILLLGSAFIVGAIQVLGWLIGAAFRFFFPVLGFFLVIGVMVYLAEYFWIGLLVIIGLIRAAVVAYQRRH